MAALALYLALALSTVTAVGVVGEVAIGWFADSPPTVMVTLDPPVSADGADENGAGHTWGPLIASQVRPVERIQIGTWSLPLAINRYTGGPPDWPARLIWWLTGSVAAVTALHVGLGATLIALVHRFLRIHAGALAAGVAAFVLAADWGFVFYRKVLGGTELLLQAAALLCIWALWSRRWTGGRHGLLALAVGLGLGLMAKSPFALTFAAICLTALLTRWDRPALRPQPIGRVLPSVGALIILTSPLWITAAHHGLAVPDAPHIRSHDFPDVQLQRVLSALSGGPSPAREGLGNLWAWAGDPLSFFRTAYGADSNAGGWSPWRAAAWAFILPGVVLAWRDRHPTPREALLRFTSLLLLVQLSALLLVARDLHHLAQAAPTLAIVVGLSIQRLCAAVTARRSWASVRLAAALATPWVVSGAIQLAATDDAVSKTPVPTFTDSGQQEIVGMLNAAGVRRLVLADYESYGMLELRAPHIDVEHAWGAVSLSRGDALPLMLRRAAGHHMLIVRASAPMIYNLHPNRKALIDAGTPQGLTVTEVAKVPGAILYAVTEAP